MPFKSRSQAGICYSKAGREIRSGRTPKWDCDTWMKETINWNTLRHKSENSDSPRKQHGISKKEFKCLSMNNKDSLIREAKRLGLNTEGTKDVLCRRLVAKGLYEIGSGPHSTNTNTNTNARSRSRSRRVESPNVTREPSKMVLPRAQSAGSKSKRKLPAATPLKKNKKRARSRSAASTGRTVKIVNPLTNRKIIKGGPTHQNLINTGVLTRSGTATKKKVVQKIKTKNSSNNIMKIVKELADGIYDIVHSKSNGGNTYNHQAVNDLFVEGTLGFSQSSRGRLVDAYNSKVDGSKGEKITYVKNMKNWPSELPRVRGPAEYFRVDANQGQKKTCFVTISSGSPHVNVVCKSKYNVQR